ncbi:hypothetical protein L2E82_25029 [Cichorium intybus]|uniref:Uncharacterized protein n=1 Tax=Cichorium intybus TaxID=13427 RepID=A0ACB9E2I3_CICIN|nr:hypothetical protein L2E82_25029 [Cichorium intybus]
MKVTFGDGYEDVDLTGVMNDFSDGRVVEVAVVTGRKAEVGLEVNPNIDPDKDAKLVTVVLVGSIKVPYQIVNYDTGSVGNPGIK